MAESGGAAAWQKAVARRHGMRHAMGESDGAAARHAACYGKERGHDLRCGSGGAAWQKAMARLATSGSVAWQKAVAWRGRQAVRWLWQKAMAWRGMRRAIGKSEGMTCGAGAVARLATSGGGCYNASSLERVLNVLRALPFRDLVFRPDGFSF